MFNAISKIMNPENFMPDAHEIAKRANAICKFHELSGIGFDGEVTYRDLMSALLMAQSALMRKSVSNVDKLNYSIKLFDILNAYIDAQRKITPIGANEIVITADNIRFAADCIINYGSNAQKDEFRAIYEKILDIALRYHESSDNIKNIVGVIRIIR